MGWQIMGTGHLRSAETEEDRLRRIVREELDRKLDELAQEALQHLKELDE